MLRVGLTGGIGSGKSTVAALFAARGVPVIDTDVIAREVVQPGEPALAEIVSAFGEEVLGTDGTLDRARLRQRVFDRPEARQRLEAILHPRIGASVRQRVDSMDAPYCLIVIPLLIESGRRDNIDRILVVDTDEARQIERTTARDKISADLARKILDVQAKREDRLAKADDVITNNGAAEDLGHQVARLHQHYLSLASRTP